MTTFPIRLKTFSDNENQFFKKCKVCQVSMCCIFHALLLKILLSISILPDDRYLYVRYGVIILCSEKNKKGAFFMFILTLYQIAVTSSHKKPKDRSLVLL